MNYGKYKWSHLWLSLGLGIAFLGLGANILLHPDALPNYSKKEAFGALVLGGLLAFQVWPKITSGLTLVTIGYIFVSKGITLNSLTLFGLFGGALSLFVWPKRHYRHRNTAD